MQPSLTKKEFKVKLEINLADRDEIAAAASLLQVLLDNTTKAGGAVESAPLAPVAPAPVAAAVPAPQIVPVVPEVTLAQPSAPLPPVATAPVVDAPMAPVAPTGPASGVELDTKGLPWDERIHSSSKAKVQSGEWKAKRGINDPSFVANVEAELRQLVAAGVSIPEAMGTMDPSAVFGGSEVPAAPTPFVPPAVPLPPAAPVAPLASADPTTFEQLMPRITPAVMAQILPPTALPQACAAHGLASVVALQTSPTHVPLVWATLKQQYPALT